MTTIDSANIDNYFRVLTKTFDGRPIFKLIWSDQETEVRRFTKRVYYNDIFIREIFGTERVKKYEYLPHRWIIEMWTPPETSCNPELPESNMGTYEPIYVFEDASGNSLPLNLRVAEIITQRAMLPRRSKMKIKTDIENEMSEKEKQLDKRDWDIINDESHLVSMFHHGEAVLMPSNSGLILPNSPNLVKE